MITRELTKDEAFLVARAKEFGKTASEREYELHVSRFLTPAEQNLFYSTVVREYQFLRERIFFWGGAVGAERRVCVIIPSFAEVWDAPKVEAWRPSFFSREREKALLACAETYFPEEDFGIVLLEVKGSTYNVLGHRDYMGSVLGLGLEREMIGDIVPQGDSSALMFTLTVSAPFIEGSLTKVRRDTVKVFRSGMARDTEIVKKFEEKLIIVASPRLDAAVAGFTGASRADAKEMCTGGLVDVNYLTEESPDRNVTEGDIVSVRGYGKFMVGAFAGETRSGRLRLNVKKYV